MNEDRICIKCNKYEAEECFTFCEFCLEVSNKDDYIKDLLEINKDINKQLQEYKEKEDKSREFTSKIEIKLLSLEELSKLVIEKEIEISVLKSKIDKIEKYIENCSYNDWCYGQPTKDLYAIIEGKE